MPLLLLAGPLWKQRNSSGCVQGAWQVAGSIDRSNFAVCCVWSFRFDVRSDLAAIVRKLVESLPNWNQTVIPIGFRQHMQLLMKHWFQQQHYFPVTCFSVFCFIPLGQSTCCSVWYYLLELRLSPQFAVNVDGLVWSAEVNVVNNRIVHIFKWCLRSLSRVKRVEVKGLHYQLIC